MQLFDNNNPLSPIAANSNGNFEDVKVDLQQNKTSFASRLMHSLHLYNATKQYLWIIINPAFSWRALPFSSSFAEQDLQCQSVMYHSPFLRQSFMENMGKQGVICVRTDLNSKVESNLDSFGFR
jgi:hypothetical protein